MIRSYLTDPIFIIRAGTPDRYQTATTSREASLGYVENGSRMIRNIEGREVVASGSVLMELDLTLTHKDKIEIEGVAHSILRIERMKDISDVGMKVYFA